MTYVINMWISYFNELVYKVIRVMSNVKKQKNVALIIDVLWKIYRFFLSGSLHLNFLNVDFCSCPNYSRFFPNFNPLSKVHRYITMVFEVPMSKNPMLLWWYDNDGVFVFHTWVYVLTASCVHKCNNWQLTLHCAVNKHAVTTTSRYGTL